jgi:hypothetical protein
MDNKPVSPTKSIFIFSVPEEKYNFTTGHEIQKKLNLERCSLATERKNYQSYGTLYLFKEPKPDTFPKDKLTHDYSEFQKEEVTQ